MHQFEENHNEIPNKFSEIPERPEEGQINLNLENKKSIQNRAASIVNGKTSFFKRDFVKNIKSLDEKLKNINRRLHSSKTVKLSNFHDNTPDLKSFFFLTFEAIKYNTSLKDIFQNIDADKLYINTVKNSLPFYKVINITIIISTDFCLEKLF